MPKAEVVSEPEAVGPLLGAAASLNPPSAPPAAAVASAQPAAPAKDSVAAHIASLLGEPSEGLSEFPSVGSESELENVVASVSARLAREFPQNDYMDRAPICVRRPRADPRVESRLRPLRLARSRPPRSRLPSQWLRLPRLRPPPPSRLNRLRRLRLLAQ